MGWLAIIGIPPLSGFFTKEPIIAGRVRARRAGPPGCSAAAALLGAGLTAFYMTRLFVLTFHGPKRWTEDIEHPHESPPIMTIPLILLAVGSVVAGWLMATSVADWLRRRCFGASRRRRTSRCSATRRSPCCRSCVTVLGAGLACALFRNGTALQEQPAGPVVTAARAQPLHRRVQRGGLREARHLPDPGAGLPRQQGHRRAGQRARRRWSAAAPAGCAGCRPASCARTPCPCSTARCWSWPRSWR